jgi:hypothetical protein
MPPLHRLHRLLSLCENLLSTRLQERGGNRFADVAASSNLADVRPNAYGLAAFPYRRLLALPLLLSPLSGYLISLTSKSFRMKPNGLDGVGLLSPVTTFQILQSPLPC